MTKKQIHDYFSALGKLGGKKSKRKLTKAQAKNMVKQREYKRLHKNTLINTTESHSTQNTK